MIKKSFKKSIVIVMTMVMILSSGCKEKNNTVDDTNKKEAKDLINNNEISEHDEVMQETYYKKGEELIKTKEYEEALKSFSFIEDYSDSKERINECYYNLALDLLSEKEYERSVEIMRCLSLVSYLDSKDRLDEMLEEVDEKIYDDIKRIYDSGEVITAFEEIVKNKENKSLKKLKQTIKDEHKEDLLYEYNRRYDTGEYEGLWEFGREISNLDGFDQEKNRRLDTLYYLQGIYKNHSDTDIILIQGNEILYNDEVYKIEYTMDEEAANPYVLENPDIDFNNSEVPTSFSVPRISFKDEGKFINFNVSSATMLKISDESPKEITEKNIEIGEENVYEKIGIMLTSLSANDATRVNELKAQFEEKTHKQYKPIKFMPWVPSYGDTKENVLDSEWGEPIEKNTITYSWGVYEQWCYENNTFVYFKDDVFDRLHQLKYEEPDSFY